MPDYVRDIARDVVANLGLESGYELAAKWIAQRYQTLCAHAKFRHLRLYGTAYLRAPISAGTVTITQDSNLVVADATAAAAIINTPFYPYPEGFSGLFFRPQSGRTWYQIDRVEDNGVSIYLTSPFAQDNSQVFASGSPSTGNTYFILPRYVDLAPDARQLGVFVCDFMYRPLQLITEDMLNVQYPNRFLVWAYPQVVALLNNDLTVSGMPRQVEVYPWPTGSVTMHYTYWRNPPLLGLDDIVPPPIDADILREGAMLDAMRNMAGRAIRAGKMDDAAYWRNEYRAQQTIWQTMIARAIRNDRGADDLRFVLSRPDFKPPADYDPLTDAYQNFLARGF